MGTLEAEVGMAVEVVKEKEVPGLELRLGRESGLEPGPEPGLEPGPELGPELGLVVGLELGLEVVLVGVSVDAGVTGGSWGMELREKSGTPELENKVVIVEGVGVGKELEPDRDSTARL